jgi:hypothetical protein
MAIAINAIEIVRYVPMGAFATKSEASNRQRPQWRVLIQIKPSVGPRLANRPGRASGPIGKRKPAVDNSSKSPRALESCGGTRS